MTKTKRFNRSTKSYISYYAVRDFHLLMYLMSVSWLLYETRPFYWYTELPSLLIIAFILVWTVLLGLHVWFVNRVQSLTEENEALKEALAERKTLDAALLRLKEEDSLEEIVSYEETKSKNSQTT